MLFADSLLDVSIGRQRRGWSSLAAYGIEALLITGAVLLPVWSTQALPHFVSSISMMGAPTSGSPHKANNSSAHARPRPAAVDDGRLHEPPVIPPTIDLTQHKPSIEGPGGDDDSNIVGAIPGPPNRGNGILADILHSANPGLPKPEPPKTTTGPMKISSGVSQGYILRQVQPVYPAMARAARVEGEVVLMAVISREGVIENLHLVSGPPLLVNAAMDAVRQWRYRPYLLNNQPVEVETQIIVRFTLGKN